jgi:hypothetical protein
MPMAASRMSRKARRTASQSSLSVRGGFGDGSVFIKHLLVCTGRGFRHGRGKFTTENTEDTEERKIIYHEEHGEKIY